MNKLYDELDKLDERNKKYGINDWDRELCFAETSFDGCSALIEKDCYNCAFYKTQKQKEEDDLTTRKRLGFLKNVSVNIFK